MKNSLKKSYRISTTLSLANPNFISEIVNGKIVSFWHISKKSCFVDKSCRKTSKLSSILSLSLAKFLVAITQPFAKNRVYFQSGLFFTVSWKRGSRLRKRSDEEFQMGIQRATASINNSLKNVKRKMKVDINVEDTQRKLISQESFIFPKKFGSKIKHNQIQSFYSHPFKDDIKTLSVMM